MQRETHVSEVVCNYKMQFACEQNFLFFSLRFQFSFRVRASIQVYFTSHIVQHARVYITVHHMHKMKTLLSIKFFLIFSNLHGLQRRKNRCTHDWNAAFSWITNFSSMKWKKLRWRWNEQIERKKSATIKSIDGKSSAKVEKRGRETKQNWNRNFNYTRCNRSLSDLSSDAWTKWRASN